jgi:hypothetical protein
MGGNVRGCSRGGDDAMGVTLDDDGAEKVSVDCTAAWSEKFL